MDLIYGKPSQQLAFKQVQEIINLLDPLGLLAMGCPDNEYDLEIKDIVSRRNEGNMSLSSEEIRVIFEYWFHPGCIKPEVSLEISKRLQSVFYP